MRRLILGLFTTCALSVGIFGSAVAQDAPEAGTITLVDFDTVNVDESVMETFYGHLRNAIAGEESMALESGGNVSMSDLYLMGGCDSPTPECLETASGFVDGDHLLYGSVQRSDDVYMFSIALFNFDTGVNIREVSEQTLRGDEEWLDEGIPAVIEHFMYGKTSSLHVEVQNSDDAEVRINGDVAGSGTTTIDELAPGEVVVVVTGSDGTEHKERLIARHEQEHKLSFDVASSVAEIEDPGTGMGPMLVPGLAATGVGVVGVVVGLLGQTQLSSAEDEANQIVGGQQAIESGDLARAQQLQSDMNSANTMRFVGFTAGTVGIVTGGVLLFMAITGDSGEAGDTDIAERSFDVDFGASSDGVSAGVSLRF